VVCASLWPDTADGICPPRFVETAKQLMGYWGERCLPKCSADSYPRFNKIARTPACLDDGMELRKALLDFIADFANRDNSTVAEYRGDATEGAGNNVGSRVLRGFA
jgi:putative DNA methylase